MTDRLEIWSQAMERIRHRTQAWCLGKVRRLVRLAIIIDTETLVAWSTDINANAPDEVERRLTQNYQTEQLETHIEVCRAVEQDDGSRSSKGRVTSHCHRLQRWEVMWEQLTIYV